MSKVCLKWTESRRAKTDFLFFNYNMLIHAPYMFNVYLVFFINIFKIRRNIKLRNTLIQDLMSQS